MVLARNQVTANKDKKFKETKTWLFNSGKSFQSLQGG